MKIIDLLNKIANGEEVPKKIFYANQYWINKYPNDYEGLGYGGCLLNNTCLDNLNDEVEILKEEKKIPEKIKDKYCSQISKVELAQKYNEIIDYLNYLNNKGEQI